jgi:hypothetical protein
MGPQFFFTVQPYRLQACTLRCQHIQVRIVANVQDFFGQYG